MSVRAQLLGDRFAALAREGAARFAQQSRSRAVIDEGGYACAILAADAARLAGIRRFIIVSSMNTEVAEDEMRAEDAWHAYVRAKAEADALTW